MALRRSITFLCIVLIVNAPAFGGKPSAAFVDADFLIPDFGNGVSELLTAGQVGTFNYQCECGNSKVGCTGTIELQKNAGSEFLTVAAASCQTGKFETCAATYTEDFDLLGQFVYRVLCNETTGTDYIQPDGEHVTITVEDSACNPGDTRDCPIQAGVCEGSVETCAAGVWSGCDYGSFSDYYESPERTCGDMKDNDCDGRLDFVDLDGDGFSFCSPEAEIDNELLISGVDGPGSLAVFSYEGAAYSTQWSSVTPGIEETLGGGEPGDFNGDGIADFVLTRHFENAPATHLEGWTYDPIQAEWILMWRTTESTFSGTVYVGDVGDFDKDGRDEILVSDDGRDTVEVWGMDQSDPSVLTREASLCSGTYVRHPKAAGDLNGNGILELVFQCETDNPIEIWEWKPAGQAYAQVGEVQAPPVPVWRPGDWMTVDDGETGDVDGDGRDEFVFCGTSWSSHVMDFNLETGRYEVVWSGEVSSYHIRTCSVGDFTGDGIDDFYDVGPEVRLFSHTGSGYARIWTGDFENDWSVAPGSSGAGDSDNDGIDEMIAQPLAEGTYPNPIWIMESENWPYEEFSATHDFGLENTASPTIIVADLDSSHSGPWDCDDGNVLVHPGALEICGGGVDENCDGVAVLCGCVDSDGDGHDGYDPVSCPAGPDCNDADPAMNFAASEICDDMLDNDCNGFFDCDDEACLGDIACSACLPTGSQCSGSAECCSSKCVGKPGAGVCK